SPTHVLAGSRSSRYGNIAHCVALTSITDSGPAQASVVERPVALPPGKGTAIMASEFAHLTQADQHIAGVKERIVKQQQLIERLATEGHSVRDAEGFLSALTGVLSAFESHRRVILNQQRP